MIIKAMGRLGRNVARTGAVCVLVSNACVAQVADLAIESVPSEITVTPLREQSVRLRARNLGPDPVASARVSLGRRFDPLLLIVTPGSACAITTDVAPDGILLRWDIGPIRAGDSVFCDFSFLATSASPTDQVNFRTSVFDTGNSDPNIFNSFATLLVNRSAIDQPTDLTISAQRIPGGIQPAGTTQRVELTVHNSGPSVVPNFAIVSNAYFAAFPFASGYRGYDIFPNPETAPCQYIRDLEPPAAIIVLLFNSPLPAGGSVRCSVSLVALDQTPVQSTLEWRASPNGPGVYDLDTSNNQVVLQIPFQTPIPVPALSGHAAALLASMVAILGLLVAASSNKLLRWRRHRLLVRASERAISAAGRGRAGG